MNRFPYIIFLIVFFVPFLTKGRMGVLPGPAVLVFELASGLIFLAALIYGSAHKVFSVSPKYLILFLAVCLHFLIGVVINSVDLTVIISGIRNYLKYTPLFLLPLVYAYSDKEMTGQLKFLIVLGLLQLPLAAVQLFALGWHQDLVAGTFVIGSIMSIFLVSSLAVLTAFYFRERISVKVFFILGLMLFIPTTLNESKGTIIILFFGLLVIMLGTALKKSQILTVAGAAAVMLSSFVVIYNLLSTDIQTNTEEQGGLVSFFSANPNEGVLYYLYSGDAVDIDAETALEASSSIIGALPSLDPETARIRRVDALVLPVRTLSEDIPALLFGLGIGNASLSPIGLFQGQYSFLAKLNVSMPALPILLWEVGILGVLLYLLFFYFIFKDARYLARDDSFSGALALGWTGVVVILVFTLPYKNFMAFEAPSALFWYVSGYIAAQRVRLTLQHANPTILR